MDHELKYFLFNKESDFRRGYLEKMAVDGNGIFPEKNSGKKGVFISRLLDAKRAGMDWHRLRLGGKENDQSSFRISVYAGDYRDFNYQGKERDLEEFILSGEITLEEKLAVIQPWLQKRVVGEDDILLHDVTGRYLFLILEVYWQHDMEKLHDIQIFFPRQTWMDYLPEVYRRSDTSGFLERFLGVFQTIYEDLSEQIRDVSRMFDMDSASGEYLLWLAEWIDFRESYIWSEEKIRQFLRQGISLYKRRGTRQGIRDVIALYTGEPPYIVENHQITMFRKDKDKYEGMQKLYGDSANFFTVLLREDLVDSRWKKKTVMRLIDSVKPAHMEWQLILIKPYIFVGEYSYLGVNTVLGKYTGVKLDGHSALSFVLLGRGDLESDGEEETENHDNPLGTQSENSHGKLTSI